MNFQLTAYAVLLLSNLTVSDCKEKELTKCILITLPKELTTGDSLESRDRSENCMEENIDLIQVSGGEIVFEFISRALQCKNNNISNCTCSEVIGVIGDLDIATASIIHTLASRSNLNITLVAAVAPSTILSVTKLATLPHVLDMNPLVHYIEALVSFTDQLNWTRIGLISDGSRYHEYVAETFQKELLSNFGRFVVPYIRLHQTIDFGRVLTAIKEYETHVVFISMDEVLACLLLKEARKMDMIWPSYAWILLTWKPNFILEALCDFEGVILLKDNSTGEKTCNGSCSLYFQYRNFYDSALAVTLADSNDSLTISNLSSVGCSGLVKFRNGRRLNNISIVQVVNNTELEIAVYKSEFQEVNIFTPLPLLAPVKQQADLITMSFLILTIIICITVVTTIMFMFLFFRNDKEVKATSFSVSLCMFLGCYLLLLAPLLSLGLLRISQKPLVNNIVCTVLAWLNLTGIPFSLILATLFVKMLRVHLIFADPFSFKKKLFKDSYLFCYIIAILSPNILILVLWSAIDPLILYMFEEKTKSATIIYYLCESTYSNIWVAILLLYMGILIVSVVIIALKTAAVRHKNFHQDSRLTNYFAFITTFILTSATIYYIIFNEMEPRLARTTSIGYIVTLPPIFVALLCVILLFAPKVFYPFKRWISQKS